MDNIERKEIMKTWNKMTKTKAILFHLEEVGEITTWEAIQQYGVTRLSCIIHNLRNRYDLPIKSEKVEFTDRYGTSSYYVKYKLSIKTFLYHHMIDLLFYNSRYE